MARGEELLVISDERQEVIGDERNREGESKQTLISSYPLFIQCIHTLDMKTYRVRTKFITKRRQGMKDTGET